MKFFPFIPLLAVAAFAPVPVIARDNPYLSLQKEIEQASARGNAFLATRFTDEGYVGEPRNPAITALALNAALQDPSRDPAEPWPDHVRRGFEWLLSTQKDDGGFYNKGLGTYNTSIALTALVAADREEYEPAIVRARRFLINQQADFDARGETDNKYDGGIGYGGTYAHSDLSNTHLAIEALALSRKVVADGKHGDQPDLDWDAAIQFVSRTQNLEETNDLDYASNDPDNKGGFVYYPGDSKAGEQELPDGRVALRSYGSMSYAGLLSLIHAQLEPSDPRVTAVKEWLGKNYTVEENPNMGGQGLYYYFHTMAKTLSAANIGDLPLENGGSADWRNDLAVKILNEQREDGSWVNGVGRWMESDPDLVTSYSLLALAHIHRSVPE